MSLIASRHADYDTWGEEWEKWRLTYEGGIEFRDEYLQKFSARESAADFEIRRKISYTPTHAKAAVNDVKNAIFQRIADVNREGGSATYQDAVSGVGSGIDLKGSTMNAYIGREILPELLTMRTVGIYVDREPKKQDTQAEILNSPYVYTYKVEDILNWAYLDPDKPWEYSALLLRDHFCELDEFGLPKKEDYRFRLLNLMDGYVRVRFFSKEGKETNETKLNIPRIPFVKPEISESLLKDIADYQIALLNVESSDLGYILKSNFPFYIEQDEGKISDHLKSSGSTDANKQDGEILVGATQGRRYGKGLNPPDFIAPPSGPIEVSMKKQQQIKDDIRLLVSLALSNVKPKQASAESKSLDERGLEAGLSYIGLELEYAERQIAQIWAMYEGTEDVATVNYPKLYSLKTEEDKITEATKLNDLKFAVPSSTYRKAISRRIANLMLGLSTSREESEAILKEVNDAKILIMDPETLFKGIEHAVIPNDLAADALGLPAGSAAKAALDHAARAKRIAEAQASVNPATPQLNENPKSQNDKDRKDTEA
jgi:hypothetical protein